MRLLYLLPQHIAGDIAVASPPAHDTHRTRSPKTSTRSPYESRFRLSLISSELHITHSVCRHLHIMSRPQSSHCDMSGRRTPKRRILVISSSELSSSSSSTVSVPSSQEKLVPVPSSREKLVRQGLLAGLSGKPFEDVKFFAFSRRAVTGQIDRPLPILANGALIRHASSHFNDGLIILPFSFFTLRQLLPRCPFCHNSHKQHN